MTAGSQSIHTAAILPLTCNIIMIMIVMMVMVLVMMKTVMMANLYFDTVSDQFSHSLNLSIHVSHKIGLSLIDRPKTVCFKDSPPSG